MSILLQEGLPVVENGAKREMRRFLSEICQMIEMCSVNAIVDFLRFQSKILYRLYIT